MFPRRKRLPRSAFPKALALGKRASSAHFLIFLPREAKGYAVVVPKKVARLSVARHALKRRVLAALRSLPTLPDGLIVFPKASAGSVSYQEVRQELAELLS